MYGPRQMFQADYLLGANSPLTAAGQRVLALLAMIDLPLTLPDLHQASKELGFKSDAGRNLTQKAMRDAFLELEEYLPLVLDGRGRYGLAAEYTNPLYLEAVSRNDVGIAGSKLLDAPDTFLNEVLNSDDRLQIITRTSFFIGDEDRFIQCLQKLLDAWEAGQPIDCTFLFYAFPANLLDQLDPPYLNDLCLVLHNHMLHFLWDQPAFFAYLAQRLDRIELAPEILALFRYLRGERHEESLQKYAISDAFRAVSDGKYKEAQNFFKQAYKEAQGARHRGPVYFKSLAGLFAAMCFASDGEVDGFEQTVLICKKAVRENHVGIRYFNTFERLIDVHTGNSKVPFDLHFPGAEAFSPSFALQTFIASIWTRWLDNDSPDPALLEIARDYARQEGFVRMVAEYDFLLDGESAFFKDTGQATLQKLLHRKAEWELKLAQLENLAVEAEKRMPGSTRAESRLVWEICEPFRDRFELQPIIQKRTRTGFTKGRKTTLVRLMTPENRPDTLTEQDEKMLSRITRSRDYWYGNSPHYVMDESAWADVIGHPNVFWPGDRLHPVEIARRNVQLSIERSDDEDNAITLKGEYDASQRVYVHKVSQHLVEVTELTSRHLAMVELLKNPLIIPAENKIRLSTLSEKLATLAMIDSNDREMLSFSQEVVGDPTPVVHLAPVGDGLRIQIFVQPFGEDVGPGFAPGQGGAHVIAQIERTHCMAIRDLVAEQDAVHRLIATCSVLPANSIPDDYRFTTDGAEDSLELLLDLFNTPEPVSVKWPKGGSIMVRGEVSENDARIRIASEQDWFAINGEVAVDERMVLDMKTLIEQGAEKVGRFVRLDDGSFIALTQHFQQQIDQLRRFGQLDAEGVKVPMLAAPALEGLEDVFADLQLDARWQEQVQRIRDLENITPDIPAGLNATLRPYQVEGFHWLSRLAHWGVGACLADDMGLGKTVQALALILSKASDGPSLVISPTSVCANWVEEAGRFAPNLNCHLLHERDRSVGLDDLGPHDLLIASYGLMVNNLESVKRTHFEVAVLDEAQAIKNPRTRRSQAARELDAGFRIAMTGTPIENHLGELWSIFNFINPGLLHSLDRFNERFTVPIEKERNPLALDQLKKLIRPFVLRRHKNDILTELPPKTEAEVIITPSSEERAFYEALRQKALNNLADGTEGGSQRFQILAEIMKLRRACCNPKLVDRDVDLPSSKLERLLVLVDELRKNNHQALIFSQFVGHLELIREALDKQKITYAYLDGSTPAKERKRQIDAFQSGQHDFFLISLKAGGTGLNLTAADYVIHMDPWWNPAVEDQASDRAHRIGQERPVTIYRLVTQDSIESRIMALHGVKRQLAEDLLAGAEISTRLSADDLISLIRDA